MLFNLQTQVVLLFILMVALANFVVGSIMGPKSDLEKARGFVGYKRKNASKWPI
jgi:solute carrier family 12 (sodium/potassium/chloride transporter), member 2